MPMLLKGEEGNEFELALIEDRLADVQDSYGDTGYATISFRVATSDEEWEETAPCLNLFEVKNLAEWLDSVAKDPSVRITGDEAEMELLEPELVFKVVKDTGEYVTLRVGFHLDGRPEEMGVDAETDEAARVDLRLTREQIRVGVEALRRDLEQVDKPMKDDLTGDEDLGEVRPPEANLGLGDIAGREAGMEDEGLGDEARDTERVRLSDDVPGINAGTAWQNTHEAGDAREARRIRLPDEAERAADRAIEEERRASRDAGGKGAGGSGV
jgi:hypothetical protein